MKSKYTKIKYTNSGIKAPLVTLMKSNNDLDRSDMIELRYPELIITINRVARKTMYNRAKSQINIEADHFIASFHVYDTINDARVVCENLYLIIKKPELDFRITTRDYDSIYEYMKGVLYNAKES
jgi:Ca2+-binding EF-hand superfamily protein